MSSAYSRMTGNRGIGSLGHLSNELNNKKGEKYLGMRMDVAVSYTHLFLQDLMQKKYRQK